MTFPDHCSAHVSERILVTDVTFFNVSTVDCHVVICMHELIRTIRTSDKVERRLAASGLLCFFQIHTMMSTHSTGIVSKK